MLDHFDAGDMYTASGTTVLPASKEEYYGGIESWTLVQRPSVVRKLYNYAMKPSQAVPGKGSDGLEQYAPLEVTYLNELAEIRKRRRGRWSELWSLRGNGRRFGRRRRRGWLGSWMVICCDYERFVWDFVRYMTGKEEYEICTKWGNGLFYDTHRQGHNFWHSTEIVSYNCYQFLGPVVVGLVAGGMCLCIMAKLKLKHHCLRWSDGTETLLWKWDLVEATECSVTSYVRRGAFHSWSVLILRYIDRHWDLFTFNFGKSGHSPNL